MSNLHPIFQNILTRAVRTVDMPPAPYDHYHGRHCSCVEEMRRPAIAYHEEDGPGPTGDAFVDRMSLEASIQHGRNLLDGCATSTDHRYVQEASR